MSETLLNAAFEHARSEFQFRPPDGLIRHGDYAIMVYKGREYRVYAVFQVEAVVE